MWQPLSQWAEAVLGINTSVKQEEVLSPKDKNNKNNKSDKYIPSERPITESEKKEPITPTKSHYNKVRLLNYSGSEEFLELKEYIKGWIVAYQMQEDSQVHNGLRRGDNISIIAVRSGKTQAGKDFILMLNNIKNMLRTEIEGKGR